MAGRGHRDRGPTGRPGGRNQDPGLRGPGDAGTGTCIGGVARCMAPAARVGVTRDFDKAGAISEHKIVQRLREALGKGPDVINLSAGGTTRKDLPLLGFEAFWETSRHYK